MLRISVYHVKIIENIDVSLSIKLPQIQTTLPKPNHMGQPQPQRPWQKLPTNRRPPAPLGWAPFAQRFWLKDPRCSPVAGCESPKNTRGPKNYQRKQTASIKEEQKTRPYSYSRWWVYTPDRAFGIPMIIEMQKCVEHVLPQCCLKC